MVILLLTNLNQISIGEKWPPDEERLKRYTENRKLFEGKHDQVFKDWVRLLRGDQQATLEMILNWHKRLSTLWGDLLLGEPPKFTAGEWGSREQKQLDEILENNNFVNTAYEVAIDISRYGDGIFKTRLDGNSIIEAIPPALWHPVVSPSNIKDIQNHVIAWTFDIETPSTFNREKKTTYLRVEIHHKGFIENKLYILENGIISNQVPLATLYPNLPDMEETGIDDFLVVPVHNLSTSDRIYGIDDYSDLDSIIQELETRVAQISRILDKHADPNMYGPDSALEQDEATGQWIVKGGGKFYPVGEGEDPPGYVTWEGQLTSAFKEIEILIEQLYILSETSAAAFGQLKSGLAESGTALRRLMMAPLAKVNRIRLRFDPAIKQTLWLASKLEANAGVGVELENINIQWQDGLPDDEKEQAEIYEIYTRSGMMSKERAIQRLFDLDPESLRQELEKVLTEANQEVPLMFRAPTFEGEE
jgi:hypothetical protein